MTAFRERHLPAWAVLVCVLACAVMDMDLSLWRERDRVIEWDVHSYYAYLPATVIYDDLALTKSDYRSDGDYFLFWPSVAENGGNVIKTTMGVAVCYAPFFLGGHAYALLSGLPANGWSAPYKIALLIGALFYLGLGLHLVGRVLRRCGFGPVTIAIVVLLIGTGTNLFCYASQSAASSHVHSFCAIALFAHLSLAWHDRPTLGRAAVLGLLLGLVSLIRPTNALVLLFFLLLDVHDRPSFIAKVRSLLARWRQLVVMAILAVLVWVPQIGYWKTIAGAYFFNPYIGERFYFLEPHILQGLFGFRKGWLIYTPMMGLALIGLFFLGGRLVRYRAAVVSFLLATIVVTFSWWCWWYGGGFGQRAMVDGYALLAIPMAACVQRLVQGGTVLRAAFALGAAFLIWLNIFQTYQFESGALHYDAMTPRLYFRQFGRMEKVEGFDGLLDHPDYDKARNGDG